jgi:hypothetical protein
VLIKIEAKEGPFEASDTERRKRIALEFAKTVDAQKTTRDPHAGADAKDLAASPDADFGEAQTSPGFSVASLPKKS